MRKLAAAFLLVSVQAYACPDLTGNYTCTYHDGSSEAVVISQEVKDGVTVYTHNGTPIPADNVTYPVPDDASLKDATFRAYCSDANTLSANLIGKYFQDGQYFGDLNLTSNFSVANGDLKNVTVGSLKNTGGEYPLNSEITCKRNP